MTETNTPQIDTLVLVEKEEARLADILQTISIYDQDRREKLANHQQDLA